MSARTDIGLFIQILRVGIRLLSSLERTMLIPQSTRTKRREGGGYESGELFIRINRAEIPQNRFDDLRPQGSRSDERNKQDCLGR